MKNVNTHYKLLQRISTSSALIFSDGLSVIRDPLAHNSMPISSALPLIASDMKR